MVIALVMGMLGSAPVAAQTLVNGNFEGAPQISGFTTVPAGSYIDFAHSWKVTLGSVDVGTGPAATRCRSAGTHCVDLNGSSRGRIEQVMSSIAGATCTVNFFMSRHNNLASSSATLRTFVNNAATSPATFSHSVSGVNPYNGKWQPHSFTFTTVGTTTTLAFESALEGGAGPQLDDVTMTCTTPVPTGSLAVHKVVVNLTGGAAPIPPAFSTTTHCSANAATPGVSTPVAVPGGQTVTQPGSLAAGTVCSVTETLPPVMSGPEGCKGNSATWTVSYSGPVTIVLGQTAVLTVTNTLSCDRPRGGTLQIHKAVVNTLGMPTPASFAMTVNCSGMAPASVGVPVNGTVTVPPAGLIPDGTVCTIVETLPSQVTGVKACPSGTASWVPSNPGPLTVHTAQTTGTIITNTLTCETSSSTGSLHVVKSVVNGTNGPAPMPATFAMTVKCTTAGPSNQAIAVAPGATGTSVSGIAAPSQCTVTETPLAPIAHVEGCKGGSASWATLISPSQPVSIAANGTTTVTVRNTLTCDKPASTACMKYTPNNTACSLAVKITRARGSATYTVTVTPAAITPSMNTAPSSSASCVNAGGTTVMQTNCGFFYSAYPTSVTLSASSSTGTLPPGFGWSGACSGSSATCVLSVTQSSLNVVANFP